MKIRIGIHTEFLSKLEFRENGDSGSYDLDSNLIFNTSEEVSAQLDEVLSVSTILH
jgi:hypothetical protein